MSVSGRVIRSSPTADGRLPAFAAGARSRRRGDTAGRAGRHLPSEQFAHTRTVRVDQGRVAPLALRESSDRPQKFTSGWPSRR